MKIGVHKAKFVNPKVKDEFNTLTPQALSKVESASYIYKRLDAGSKRRLLDYQKSLSRPRGHLKPLFDDRVEKVILNYAMNSKFVKEQIEYLNQVRDEDGFLFSRDLSLYYKISDAMIRFADVDHPSFIWNRNFQKAKNIMINEFSKLKLSPVSYNSDDDIKDILPKLNAHSGFTFITTGLKEKRLHLEGSLAKYREHEEKALASGRFDEPILLGSRTQASGEYTENGEQTNFCKHKRRVVSMIEFYWGLAEFRFMNPLQKYLSDVPYYAGGKDDREITMRLRDWWSRSKYQKFISLDYSNYDQTISGWLMREVYGILETAFVMTDNEKKLWDALVDSAINKVFIVSEGVIKSHKGLPSGLPSTQILGTLVNRLLALTYFISIDKEFDMMAMGDDNIIFCGAEVELSKLGSYINKNFGMVVNVDKSTEKFEGSDPEFLSRRWTMMGPWRDKCQLLSRMLFPERRRDYRNVHGVEVTPEEVIYGFIMTYRAGISALIDVERFMRDNPYLSQNTLKKLGTRYLPGALSYRLEYGGLAA